MPAAAAAAATVETKGDGYRVRAAEDIGLYGAGHPTH